MKSNQDPNSQEATPAIDKIKKQHKVTIPKREAYLLDHQYQHLVFNSKEKARVIESQIEGYYDNLASGDNSNIILEHYLTKLLGKYVITKEEGAYIARYLKSVNITYSDNKELVGEPDSDEEDHTFVHHLEVSAKAIAWNHRELNGRYKDINVRMALDGSYCPRKVSPNDSNEDNTFFFGTPFYSPFRGGIDVNRLIRGIVTSKLSSKQNRIEKLADLYMKYAREQNATVPEKSSPDTINGDISSDDENQVTSYPEKGLEETAVATAFVYFIFFRWHDVVRNMIPDLMLRNEKTKLHQNFEDWDVVLKSRR